MLTLNFKKESSFNSSNIGQIFDNAIFYHCLGIKKNTVWATFKHNVIAETMFSYSLYLEITYKGKTKIKLKDEFFNTNKDAITTVIDSFPKIKYPSNILSIYDKYFHLVSKINNGEKPLFSEYKLINKLDESKLLDFKKRAYIDIKISTFADKTLDDKSWYSKLDSDFNTFNNLKSVSVLSSKDINNLFHKIY